MNIDHKDTGLRPVTLNIPGYDPAIHCFYCHKVVAEGHTEECVILQKTVVVRVSFDMVQSVPRHWDNDLIEQHRGGQLSYCMSNLFHFLRWENEHFLKVCLCQRNGEAKVLRDATEEDHKELDFYDGDDNGV